MADIDFERAAVLMDVIHKVSTISPGNTNILGMAMDELRDIESEARSIREKVVKERKAKEAAEAVEAAKTKNPEPFEDEEPAPRFGRKI